MGGTAPEDGWHFRPPPAVSCLLIESHRAIRASNPPHTQRLPSTPFPTLQLLAVLDMVNAGLAGPGVLTERAADFSRVKRVTTFLESSLLHLADSLVLFTC